MYVLICTINTLNLLYNPNINIVLVLFLQHISNFTSKLLLVPQVQSLLIKTQRIRANIENITFEHLDVSSTVRYMSGVHIFISVHGAGMTNMFFMNPGSAVSRCTIVSIFTISNANIPLFFYIYARKVVEIIPFPLCNCASPDFFFGVGGYYHGSASAQGIRHYHYCVPEKDIQWSDASRPDIKVPLSILNI